MFVKQVISFVLFSLVLDSVLGACPNACSGNGICGQYDSCICYSNFQGGDCSERICMFGQAWVNSPNGDINLDGDLYDSTQYSDDFKFASSAYFLTTDSAPGGTWEYWPSFFSMAKDEGHHYMECSNRGTCNRGNGMCQCFPGYEGTACTRRSCPNDCSGNGICLSVNQLLTDYNAEHGDTRSYELWDADMSRSCKCDAGYTGFDCSEKICPKGDDPLTTQFQINEVQWIEIYATTTTAGANGLDGSAKFTFTDEYGSAWETDPVDIQAYDASASATAIATAVETALENLPGKVLQDVTVTAGYCETVLPGTFLGFDASAAGAAKYAGNGGANPAGIFLRCPQSSATKDQEFLVVNGDDFSVYHNPFAGDSGASHEATAKAGTRDAAGAADVTCHQIVYPECIRLKVEFVSSPGALINLQVDTSAVTMSGKTMSQDATVGIASSVTDELLFVVDDEATFGYDFTASQIESSADDQGIINPSSKEISFGTAADGTITFPKNAKIALYCTDAATSIEHYLGQYTCASTTTAGATITVKEYIAVPNGLCASVDDGTVKVNLLTEFIATNVDLTNEDLVGQAIEFSHFGSEKVEQVIESVQFDVTTSTGQIFLLGTTSLTQDVSSATGDLILFGKGTKENVECSDRGLCNVGTGLCQCFRGYKGEACNIQDVLAQ